MFNGHVKLDRENLICIAGRPGMGKTSLALHIALEYAKKSNKKVYIFSLEMLADQIYSRMLSYLSEVDMRKIREGELSEEDNKRIFEATKTLQEMNIVIDDETNISVDQIDKKLENETNLGLVVIDYLQLMKSKNILSTRKQEIDEISRDIKRLAQEKGVPVIVTSHLGREIECRQYKRPLLYDLKKVSEDMTQVADTVVFPYREEYYNIYDFSDDYSIAKIIIAKNNYGSTNIIKYKWHGRFTKFSELKT